jgi:uncharacterized protein (TIGR03546 family)
MTLLLKQIFNIIKLLNSDRGTNQIASAIACGMILGFTPAFSLQTVVIVLIIFFFRVQFGVALLTTAFFAIPAYWLDPAFHQVGSWVLERESFRPLLTSLYHMPIIPMTRFYNSVVMGSGIVAFLLALPVFFLSRMLINAYRTQIVARFEKSVFWKAFTAHSLYQWYSKFEALHG